MAKLAADYQHMVNDGLFLDEAESLDALLQQCQAIQQNGESIMRRRLSTTPEAVSARHTS